MDPLEERQCPRRLGRWPTASSSSVLVFVVMLFLTTIACRLDTTSATEVDCDPCIDRSSYQIASVLPKAATSAMKSQLQTSLDMNIDLVIIEAEDSQGMAEVILQQAPLVDALVITIPDAIVQGAVEEVLSTHPDLPIFGWGWGYQEFASQTLGWIASDAVSAGQLVAGQLRQDFAAHNETLSAVALIHAHADDDLLSGPTRVRWQAFLEAQVGTSSGTPQQGRYDTIPVTPGAPSFELIEALESCQYQVMLIADTILLEQVLEELAERESCASTTRVVVLMDDYQTSHNPSVYKAITRRQVSFALNPQVNLQAGLPVLMAALFVTTDKRAALPIESSTYWSGPIIYDVRNAPSDTMALCEEEAFPVCQPGSDTSEEEDDIEREAEKSSIACACTKRRQIRIGGVLHGDTADAFWDPVFVAASQAAEDMRIDLDLERFQPQESMDLIYEQMAARIRNLCDSGVDGIFVTIPADNVVEAVRRCHELRVPVVSVNSGKGASEELGLVHHIGQDEYSGGYGGAVRMIAAGMTRGYCVDHAFGNTALKERCQGFQDAIAASGGGVTFGSHIAVPSDNQESYLIAVSEAVEADGDWAGVGLIGFGADPFPSFRRIAEEHPGIIGGTFDTSDIVFDGIRDGIILFGINQEPFLQGKLPVYLLSYMVYTQQALTNHIIQSGPAFVEDYPSDAKQVCEANFYDVCPDRPSEDLSYIPGSLIALGYALFGLLTVACAVAFAWTYYFRERWVVKVSQPMFLYLVVLGCLISGLSIVFMAFQTSYRQARDESGEFTNHENPDIQIVDAGCMAVPWFYGLGFVITFSALFAKIHRVKLIYQAGAQMRRKQVTIRDVLPVMAIMFSIEVCILLSWQLVSPLRWEREIVDELDGYATESVGSCEGGARGWRFYLGLVVFHVLCLCYALVLCFQTKDINSDFAESSYVSLAVVFMFQVLVLAVPISALVRDNTDVLYFVRAAAVFLQNFTVVVLIFVPKMLRMKEEHRNPSTYTTRTTLHRQSGARGPQWQSGSMRYSFNNNPSNRPSSWAGASFSGIDDPEPFKRSVKLSDGDLSAIREEEEDGSRLSSSGGGFTRPERAPVSGNSLESDPSGRRSVKFDSSVDDSVRDSRASFVLDSKYLSQDEVESKWKELGFPSKEKAMMIVDLFSRSTDATKRKTILEDCFKNDQNSEVSDVRKSHFPENVPARAFNDQLRSALSELEVESANGDNEDGIETVDGEQSPNHEEDAPTSKIGSPYFY